MQGYLEAVHFEKRSGVKIYKLCDNSEYTYDMGVHLGQGTWTATGNRKAMHTAFTNMAHTVKSTGHKVPMDNSFSCPDILVT
jgi:tagatose-1,6-bisphosphate aldolase non-catalytic subunit AgaZ/GatZ